MKRSLFLKALCCLLAMFLLSGCTSKSPLLAHADDDTSLTKETVDLDIMKVSRVKNAEGKELSWYTKVENPLLDGSEGPDAEPQGTMEYTVLDRKFFDEIVLAVPFSKVFTVHSAYDLFPEEISAENKSRYGESGKVIQIGSYITFHTETQYMNQGVTGSWSRAVYHCNNVMELYGEESELEFNVRFVVGNRDHEKEDILKYDAYNLEGKGGDHVIVALVNGEILTEGMMGNYTVKESHRLHNEVTEIVKEYDQDGNLLSTRSE